LREDIDLQPHQFKSILTANKFRETFFPKVKKGDEKKIVDAFCKMSGENALKKKPKVGILSFQELGSILEKKTC